jgi:hypothetical protein
MFEHRSQPIISRPAFLRRLGKFTLLALGLVLVSWFIGILGYRLFEGLPWVDATLNAAMILGGMGPVNQLYTNAGKIFASLYALFSGVIFLVSLGVLLTPIIHRLFHKFHQE